MVPVRPAPEPAEFDVRVRRPGNAWILRKKLDPDAPVPTGVEISPYWRHCADDLWNAYDGVCAYSCIFTRKGAANPAVEHFAPKSRRLRLAYEWSNYRLACLTINSKKKDFEDVMDPFEVGADTFFLELAAGRIYVNPEINDEEKKKHTEQTIVRLGLDQQRFRDDRTFDFDRWRLGEWTDAFMERRSPFVWKEIVRQGLKRSVAFLGTPPALD